MVFTRDPLVPPGSETLTFDSRAIPSATYAENNGVAELAVVGSVPLLATFSNDRRTITITPAPQTARAVPQAPNQMPAPFPQAPAQQAGMPSAASTPAAGGTATNAVPLQYFAVVDASHGGDERGAALGAGLAEKDVTLALARRLRQELAARGLAALVLRDGDMTLSPDQRANLANTAHPGVYICLHVTSEGMGVRVYTAFLPMGSDDRGPFLDWDTAQSAFRPTSQAAAASVVAELRKRQLTVRSLLAPLRPLNNVAAAAIAIEVAPQAGGTPELNSPAYQELVAESVAAGIANMHDKLGAPR